MKQINIQLIKFNHQQFKKNKQYFFNETEKLPTLKIIL